MKNYRNIICALVLPLAAGLCTARAEVTEETEEPQQETATVSKTPSRSRGQLARLTEALSLTEEQRTQVASVLKDSQVSRRQIKDDSSLTADVKSAKRRELLQAQNARIRELLTPDQQVLFDELLKRRFKRST